MEQHTQLRKRRPLLLHVKGLRLSAGARGLTQGELAERAGVTRKQLARLEQLRRHPVLEQLLRVAIALGVALEEAFAPEHCRTVQAEVAERTRPRFERCRSYED